MIGAEPIGDADTMSFIFSRRSSLVQDTSSRFRSNWVSSMASTSPRAAMTPMATRWPARKSTGPCRGVSSTVRWIFGISEPSQSLEVFSAGRQTYGVSSCMTLKLRSLAQALSTEVSGRSIQATWSMPIRVS